jgi:alginate O-acetyltransferase complex protein AlgI
VLFNSPTFIVFFVVVYGAYWLLRERRLQNVWLLAASYIFYGTWSWRFLTLLMASTLLDYVCALLIDRAKDSRTRRLVLSISLAANLTILGTFKYLGFFVAEAADFLAALGFDVNLPVLEIVLPIGVSFYTFQSMGYIIDVYRKKVSAARSLTEYALFVAFFPQLVAGPIQRANELLPQFRRDRTWSAAALESGAMLIVWGLFKKVVIADNLGPYVDAIYSDVPAHSGPAIATAVVFYAFQIYCDFSGYTDTARGVARTLGFELARNFDHPYISKTPVEFWRRWHISLSQWFQDYLYFPLAMRYMRKGGWASKYKAHIVAMTLIGFWHGAAWTFVLFGFYWGVAIASYVYFVERFGAAPAAAPRAETALRARLRGGLAIAGMFVLVCFGWILFRANSLGQVGQVLAGLLSADGVTAVLRPDVAPAWGLWLLVGGLLVAEWLYRSRTAVLAPILERGPMSQALRNVLIAGILITYLSARESASSPFIYFQF